MYVSPFGNSKLFVRFVVFVKETFLQYYFFFKSTVIIQFEIILVLCNGKRWMDMLVRIFYLDDSECASVLGTRLTQPRETNLLIFIQYLSLQQGLTGVLINEN